MEAETLIVEQETKKVYSPPVLAELGSLKSQTQGSIVGAGADPISLS